MTRPIRIRLFLPLLLVIVCLGAAVAKLLEEHVHDQAALDEAHEEIANERHLRRRAEEAAKKLQVAAQKTAPPTAAPPAPEPAAPVASPPSETAPRTPEGTLVPRLHLDVR